jgi:parallel beta-helix repeat protein
MILNSGAHYMINWASDLRVHLLLAAVWLALLPLSSAGTLTVDSTGDAGTCGVGQPYTLRCALKDAKAGDTIAFNIPACGGVCTVKPGSQFPAITVGTVIVDGLTQPGSQRDKLLVEIDGSAAGASNGLNVFSGGNTIKGLVINNFKQGVGILISTVAGGTIEAGGGPASQNTVTLNLIGTNPGGDQKAPNQIGIRVTAGADKNRIIDNLISGNTGYGIALESSKNTVEDNRVGTDKAGKKAIKNQDGIFVMGRENEIGPKNLVSGNSGSGIYIAKANAIKNHVFQNKVGTTKSGTAPLGNNNGVQILEASDNTVEDNCASGNYIQGIHIQGAFGTGGAPTVGANHILRNIVGPGCNRQPLNPKGNRGDGIHIDASTTNEVIDNTVTGNGANGVTIEDADLNVLERNRIGINDGYGVSIQHGNRGAFQNRIGPENHIVTNKLSAVHVEANATKNKITQNYMGGNKTRGIELDPPGPGPAGNDGLPAPNGIASAVAAAGGHARDVTGQARPGCTVEFFVARPDATGRGQGGVYLGSVVANAAGNFTFTQNQLAGKTITATATDAAGNTSQFSANVKIP